MSFELVRWPLLFILAVLPARAQQTVPREVAFPSDGLTIPGTLTLPPGKVPSAGWPLVVFVHGSGPNDRDETLGQNKPFEDIAKGLADHSIASLRYDKRTWLMAHGKIPAAPDLIKHISFATEVVDDAVAALAFTSSLPGIDPKRIFLLGHSLGGSLAPRIARERLVQTPGSVRGLIELAAGALPVTLILPTQVGFQNGVARASRASQQLAIVGTEAVLNTALDPGSDPAGPSAIGVPNSYIREWNALDTAADLRQLGLPALVLHGQRDVQISYMDYVLLARAATASGSKALEFQDLGHLFLPVPPESGGGEFMTTSTHVPAIVAETIAAWLPQ